ncbi:MAG: selenium cofactor biosynthesis protein YqeC [Parafannyhessea sp.]|uniref:selenium cofactor biosynthesis protein YqeC n=1 Tax=Parafannyhessea sp. TaxID=2847324 RepID=UPI003F0CA7FE
MGLAEELGIGRGITAVIGSGGKTSLLDALARELDGTVVLTTTTHVLPFGCPVLEDADERDVEQAFWYSRVVCVGTPAGDGSGKLSAPRLKMRTLSVLADYVLVEADGAARHPLKAHADHEPVIPQEADRVVQVVGASGFGRPVTEAVHRPELFCRLAGCDATDVATPQLVARAVAAEHAAGLRADVLLLSQIAAGGGDDATAFEQALRAEGDQVPVVRWDALA